jgi:DNA-binding SARP family transcriptional activator
MQWAKQQALFKAIVKEEMDLLTRKGAEYASDADALANFKKRAEDIGIDPKQILWIFLSKHLDSIKSFVKKGKEISDEPIAGRIQDARNYLFLLHCLIDEAADLAKKETPANT